MYVLAPNRPKEPKHQGNPVGGRLSVRCQENGMIVVRQVKFGKPFAKKEHQAAKGEIKCNPARAVCRPFTAVIKYVEISETCSFLPSCPKYQEKEYVHRSCLYHESFRMDVYSIPSCVQGMTEIQGNLLLKTSSPAYMAAMGSSSPFLALVGSVLGAAGKSVSLISFPEVFEAVGEPARPWSMA